MSGPGAITEFRGPHRFLSNFYPTPVRYEGVVWATSEHAYQAAKLLPGDPLRMAMTRMSAGEAKRAGRRGVIRADWEREKVRIMREIVRAKFANPAMRAMLLTTGTRELIEGNWWGDRFWGVCGGTGQNMLGKILMEIREGLR